MGATKTRRQLNAAGTAVAINTVVSATEWDTRTLYFGSRLIVKITNGPSAPSTAPTVAFFVGGATGEKAYVTGSAGDTVANSVNYAHYILEQGDMFVNADVKGGLSNGSTIEVYALEATGL